MAVDFFYNEEKIGSQEKVAKINIASECKKLAFVPIS